MLALSFPGQVRVVRLQHRTMCAIEVPDSGHPAAAAAALVPGPAKQVLVELFVRGAIDDMLLGEVDRRRVVPLGDEALDRCVSSEGVAGTAATLVFDGVHEAICSKIDVCGVSYELPALLAGPVVIKPRRSLPVLDDKTQFGILLNLSEIGESVGLEPGSVP